MSYDADIIILSLDRADDTIAAIESARGQTGLSKRIQVLDQGSRPESLRRLRDAAVRWDDVALIEGAENLGVAAGRNLLSGLGRGRAIIALDSDAEFATTDTASRLVAALDAEPDLAAVGCRIVRHADGGDDVTSWGYPARLLARAGDCFDATTYVGAGHAIRRAAWEHAGGYDPRLFFCWEEYDFCLRAIGLGWRVRYRGDIVVRHKVAAEQRVAWSGRRWFYFVRNRLYIERKLGRPWLALVPRIVGYCVKGCRNGVTMQTARAVLAAAEMHPADRRKLPAAARSYLRRNDQAHRGTLPYRLWHEVFSRNAVSTTGQ